MENQIGFFRLPQVLEIYPVSKSEWWKGVRERRYPAGVKLSSRITAWRKSDIYALAEKIGVDKDGVK